MTLPLLEIHTLRKYHAARRPVFCAEIDRLTLFAGQAAGITGSSGCGKSTLLEMLALLTQPSGAELFALRVCDRVYDLSGIWERDSRQLAAIRRAHMGFIHQTGGLYPFLTVRQNIGLPLRLNGQNDTATNTRRVDELLDFLGLQHVASGLPETLSYGERQRAAVARALAHQPRLILADEPTSALDPDSARAVMGLLLKGARLSEAALLVVSHDHALLAAAGIPTFTMRPASDSRQDEVRYTLSIPPPEARSDSSENSAQPAHEPDGHRQKRFGGLSVSCFLAWRDFCHERALSLCAILAFAAALTPLMVLGGLRAGVIATLSQRLLHNPAALAVNPYSSQRYTDADIAALAALPSVAFIVPLTRTLASTLRIVRAGRPPATADALPTAPGDPLLERYASVPPEDGAVITQELARSLPGVVPGSELTLLVSRRHEGHMQEVSCAVRVHAVLPDAADWKARMYLPLSLLLDMERYRDGLTVAGRNWSGNAGGEDGQRSYAGFRMYVNSLEAVIPMRDELKRRGIDAYTFAREVEAIQSLKQALTLTTLLVGGVTLAGMAFSLASLAVANVRRKARFFAQGSVMGLSRRELLALPLLQMTFVALLAASCSLLFYGCAAAILDTAAAPWLRDGESACSLPPQQVAVLYAGSLVLACLCGVAACRRLLRLQPAEVLRRDA